MRGGGLAAPPPYELKVMCLVGCVVGWLRCGLCPRGVWGIGVVGLLRMCRCWLVVCLGIVL